MPNPSGKVFGDLSGSIFEPQVKSIANVTIGTLSIAHGGTSLTGAGTSGSLLVSNGSALILTTSVSGSGGVSAEEVSGAINNLTSSISASYVQKNGTTFTGAITASAGISASFYRFSDGTQLSSSAQFGTPNIDNTSGGDLLLYQSNWVASKTLTGSYILNGTLKLDPQSTLPVGSLGKIAVSGSNSYFHDGTSWRLINLT